MKHRNRRLAAALRAGVAEVGGKDTALLLAARAAMSGQRALVGVVVPIYLARRGFSGTEVGGLFTAVGLASAALSAAVGFGADRFGLKPFVVYVPLLSAVAALLYGYVSSPVALSLAAAVGTFGRGAGAGAALVGPYQPAEQALLAGLVDDRRRPRLFGLVASASAAGGLLGAVLAASPLTLAAAGPVGPPTYRPDYLAAAALALLAALLAAGVREPGVARRQNEGGRRPVHLSKRSRALVLRLGLTNLTNGIAVGLFGPFLSYWLYRRFGAGPATVGLVYVLANGITILTNLLAAPLARRCGTVRTVVAARASQALLLVALAFSPTLSIAAAVYTLRLVIQRVGLALRQSFVMGAAPPAERARAAALSQLPSQGATAFSPAVAGYLFDEVALAVPFAIAAAFQLLNALLFHHFFGRQEERAAGADQGRPATVARTAPPARSTVRQPCGRGRGGAPPPAAPPEEVLPEEI